MRLLRSINPAIAIVALVAIVAAIVVFVIPHGGRRTVVADFPQTVSLYKGSDVRILGVPVGKVESVTPVGTKVRVKFTYDDKYKVPADAKAVVISPSIVGDRFIQLTPAYKGGPVLADDAHLGTDRTGVPLELDQIFGSLNELNKALGPQGANKPDETGTGALTRLLDSTARNFGGHGVQFNETLKNFSKLSTTLANNKDELFGATAQVERFVNALAKNDDTVRRFNDSLQQGSGLLADDRQELAAALKNLSTALVAVKGFVRENRDALHTNIKGLARLSDTLVKRRGELDQILTTVPVALNNLSLAYSPNTGTLDTRDNIGELFTKLSSNPGTTLCLVFKQVIKNQPCPFAALGRAAPFQQLTKLQQANRQHVDLTLAGLVPARGDQ
jgi:phospholipid/cholesterol/gamma-HCH transport system substrate-binding protein